MKKFTKVKIKSMIPKNCPKNYEGVGDDRCFLCQIGYLRCPYKIKEKNEKFNLARLGTMRIWAFKKKIIKLQNEKVK